MRTARIGRGLLLAILAYFIISPIAFAETPAPIVVVSDWRSGEIEVAYKNVIPGATIKLFIRQHDMDDFMFWDTWVAETSEGSHITKYIENGQTVWYYITQIDPVTNIESSRSNIYRVTPPITAFIINWPEMWGEMTSFFEQLNMNIVNKIEQMFTPSDQAMQDLMDAIDNLKGSLGMGSVENAGGQLQDGIGNVIGGLNPPIVVDDGEGTFTGGSSGGNLPFPNQNTGGGINIEYPNPDSGTNNELTFRIPYGVDMNGEFLYLKIFTDEQLEKMKWLGLLRTLAAATMWILFAFWLVSRFAPILKS